MYRILKHPDNDLILVIDPQASEPDGPMLICDGGDTALLFHSWTNSIKLKDLSSETSDELKNAKTIYVFEMSDGQFVREYTAPIRIVRDVKSLMM